jgi:hypothetical protein
MVEATEREVEIRGPHAALFDGECDGLVEGPLGTGKSFAALYWVHWAALKYPGSRWLLARKKRVDMTQSTLVTWEGILGPGHPAIHGTAGRGNRHSYQYPNGSEVVVGGMNNPGAVLSAEYDGAFCDEFVEFTREDYELITGRLRNGINSGVPFARFLAATNPRNQWHWVNIAAEEGLFARYLSRHCHNPAWYDAEKKEWTEHGIAYLNRIAKGLSGERFEQYFRGIWASATGMVYPMFDPAIHVIDAEAEYVGAQLFVRRLLAGGTTQSIEIAWTIACVDWGFTNPGSMIVFGFDRDQTAYLLAEIYQAEQTQDWWADRVVEFREEFDLSRIVCDSAEPDRIKTFNDYLGTPGGRPEARLAVAASKSVLTDIAHFQSLLAPTHSSDMNPTGSRVYILRNTLRFGRDKGAASSGKPCCLREELSQLYWQQNEEGKPIKERVDPTLPDHAENAARYGLRWAWRKDLTLPPEMRPIVPGSFADVLDHRKRLEEAQQRRRR